MNKVIVINFDDDYKVTNRQFFYTSDKEEELKMFREYQQNSFVELMLYHIRNYQLAKGIQG